MPIHQVLCSIPESTLNLFRHFEKAFATPVDIYLYDEGWKECVGFQSTPGAIQKGHHFHFRSRFAPLSTRPSFALQDIYHSELEWSEGNRTIKFQGDGGSSYSTRFYRVYTDVAAAFEYHLASDVHLEVSSNDDIRINMLHRMLTQFKTFDFNYDFLTDSKAVRMLCESSYQKLRGKWEREREALFADLQRTERALFTLRRNVILKNASEPKPMDEPVGADFSILRTIPWLDSITLSRAEPRYVEINTRPIAIPLGPSGNTIPHWGFKFIWHPEDAAIFAYHRTWNEHSSHPHRAPTPHCMNSGDICWGGFAPTLASACASLDLITIVTLIEQWIYSYDINSRYTSWEDTIARGFNIQISETDYMLTTESEPDDSNEPIDVGVDAPEIAVEDLPQTEPPGV